MIYRAIKDLAQYGIAKGLIEKEDEVYRYPLLRDQYK